MIIDCPFCKNDVIAHSFANESGYYAIYNHAPVTYGHSLIIPDKHVTDLLLLPEAEFIQLFKFARKVMGFLNDFFMTSEFDMSLQQGVNAGQSIEHLHLHLIPRRENDLPFGEEWFQKLSENQLSTLDSKVLLDDEVFKEISDKLRSTWNSQFRTL